MQNRRNALWLLIIFLLLIGLFTGRAVFFNLAYLFGGLILLSLVWSLLAVRGVRLGRRTRTRRSQVGRNFSELFSVRNTWLFPKLWLEVRDHSTLPGHRASHVVPTLFPRRRYEWRVDTSCIVRGEFQLGPMTVISGDPFGLFLTPRRINAIERMIIYPATVPITSVNLPRGVVSGGEAQQHLTQNITTNAAGVREYVPGDSINRIHWKSTARRGKLIVKEFEIDPLMDIWLLVDFSALSVVEEASVQRLGNTGSVIPSGYAIPPSTEEYAVIIAASLATHFMDNERALGFAAYTPNREVYQPERGHSQLTHILETLAVARSFSQHSLKEMLALEIANIARGATLIIVTSSLDKGWINQVQILGRRGIRPMCIFIDPASFMGGQPFEEMRGLLQLARIPTITIRKNDNLTVSLAQRPI
ncbi:MAG: DUF58 domain-containing protein [Anaerolineae bacterium]|nr:DUF58 domain-containing protein [Anaerolineae bacterium]